MNIDTKFKFAIWILLGGLLIISVVAIADTRSKITLNDPYSGSLDPNDTWSDSWSEYEAMRKMQSNIRALKEALNDLRIN